MEADERPPTPWVTAALVGVVVGLAFVFRGAVDLTFGEFPLDDGWIHQVYARGLWRDGAPTYNPGVPEAGFSSALWIIVLAPVSFVCDALGVSVVGPAKLLSLVFGVAAAAGVGRLAGLIGAPRWAARSAAAWTLLAPGFAFAAVSGMEATLAAACVVWGMVAMLRGDARAIGGWLTAAALARPEAALLLLPAAWIVFRTAGVRSLAWVLAPAVLAGGAWFAHCLSVSGHPLPNTFYVKASAGVDGLGYLAIQVFGHRGPAALVVEALLMAAFLAALREPDGRRDRGLVLATWLVPLLVIAASYRLDARVGFYMRRYFATFTPLEGAVGALGLARLVARVPAREQGLTPRRVAVLSASLWVATLIPRLEAATLSHARHCADVRELHTDPARDVIAALPPDVVVGVEGAGAAAYFGDHTIVDMLGLNTHQVAHAGDEAGARACAVNVLRPTAFVVPFHFTKGLESDYELRLLQQWRVEAWSVFGGATGRSVFALAASPRPGVVENCERRLGVR